MVIVFVVDWFNSATDGTIVTAKRFKDELEKRGHTVRIASYGVSGENEFGLSEHRMPIVSNYSKKFNVTYAKFDKKIMTEAFTGADLVHLFLPFQLQRKALKLARSMNIPVCAAFHVHPENFLHNGGLGNSRILSNLIFWKFRHDIYDKVEHIHCPTEFTANELRAHGYKAKLHVISNGVAPCFKPAVIAEDKEKEYFDILMIGRLAAEKRQDLLIKAVKDSKYADKIRLTFAGNGPLKEVLAEQAEELKNPVSFAFLKQDDLLSKIHKSDLYVHAADVEIEGIACIEAFSSGLVPVISNAKYSAAGSFAIDERSLFEAGNADDLRKKIEYWIENPAERKLQSQAYAEKGKAFSLSASVDKGEEMFKEAIRDGNSSSNFRAAFKFINGRHASLAGSGQ